MAHVSLKDVIAFNDAEMLSNMLWKIVQDWEVFNKITLGEQIVKSVDSISANIAEGFGRYFKKDKIKFYYYARGSSLEAHCWIEKCYHRKMINNQDYKRIKRILNSLPKSINALISMTNEKLDK